MEAWNSKIKFHDVLKKDKIYLNTYQKRNLNILENDKKTAKLIGFSKIKLNDLYFL